MLHGVTHVDVTEFLIIKCDGLQLGRVLLALLYTQLPQLRGREGTWGEWSGWLPRGLIPPGARRFLGAQY